MSDPDRYRSLLKRILISQAVIALILVGSSFGFMALSAQKPEVEKKELEEPILTVDTFSAKPVSYREVLTAWGTAKPKREVVIAAQVSGEIREVHPQLDVGESVSVASRIVSSERATHLHPGDALLQLDERDYVNRVRQTQNRINETTRDIEQLKQQQVNSRRLLEKAKADVLVFEEEYERYKKILNASAGAASEATRALVDLQRQQDAIVQLENAASLFPHQISAAEERLANSQAELDRAQDDLERTRIVPPFDGILSEVMVEQGQYVRAGEPLFRLTDPQLIEIPVAIGIDDWHEIAGALRAGQAPDVVLATGQSRPAAWKGRIVRVAPEADPESRTIQAFVEVNNEQQKEPLLPGTFVHARITGTEKKMQIVIPRESILAGHVFVVKNDNSVRRQVVREGRRLKSLVVILEGLQGGEQLATTNLNILQPGQQVTVNQTATLTSDLSMKSLR